MEGISEHDMTMSRGGLHHLPAMMPKRLTGQVQEMWTLFEMAEVTMKKLERLDF